jgi:hypothetical protein
MAVHIVLTRAAGLSLSMECNQAGVQFVAHTSSVLLGLDFFAAARTLLRHTSSPSTASSRSVFCGTSLAASPAVTLLTRRDKDGGCECMGCMGWGCVDLCVPLVRVLRQGGVCSNVQVAAPVSAHVMKRSVGESWRARGRQTEEETHA